ncbi:serine hydrolase [candidate division KSB1 bacterium]|nr:serine hydrolase [candidate division KSB1 bacterium]
MKRFSIALILLTTFQTLPADTAFLDSTLQAIRQKYDVVGQSVVVTRSGEIVFSGYSGQRDLSRRLPVDEKTTYRIASISKMVTATALMQLYEQGRFHLTDRVDDYLDFSLVNPRFPDQPITFEQLLAHTSSLRDGSNYSKFLSETYTNDPPPKLAELLVPGGRFYSSDMYATQSPDKRYFQYANINYGLIGTLVERLSGERFDRYCRDHVLQPLGISGSFNVCDLPDIDDLAVLYRKSGNRWIPQFDHYSGRPPTARDLSAYTIGDNGVIFAPQGGLRCSAEDLAKFMLAHRLSASNPGTPVLSDTTLQRMQESIWRYKGNNGNSMGGIFKAYALGNHTTRDLLPGETLIGHPGEAYGLISDLYFSADADYGIILITNGGQWGPGTSGWFNIEEEVFRACFAELPNLPSVSVETRATAPKPQSMHLQQNYPNPFNPSTTIEYALTTPQEVRLVVCDALGRTASILHQGRQAAGSHRVSLDAAGWSAGIYIARLETAEQAAAIKLLLMK